MWAKIFAGSGTRIAPLCSDTYENQHTSGTQTLAWRIEFLECLVHAMLFGLLGATILLGAITGFLEFSKGRLFKTLGGQIVHGMVSIACFVLEGVAFWRFGWKIGLLDFFLVIVGSNIGLALQRIRLAGQ